MQRPLGHGNDCWNRASNPHELEVQRKTKTRGPPNRGCEKIRVRKIGVERPIFKRVFQNFPKFRKKSPNFRKFYEISKTFTLSTKSTPNPGNEGPFWNFLEVFGNRLFFGRQPRQGRPTEGATKSLFSRGFPKFPAMKIF